MMEYTEIDKYLFNNNLNKTIINSPRVSGKTTAILNYATTMFKLYSKRVLIVTPNLHTSSMLNERLVAEYDIPINNIESGKIYAVSRSRGWDNILYTKPDICIFDEVFNGDAMKPNKISPIFGIEVFTVGTFHDLDRDCYNIVDIGFNEVLDTIVDQIYEYKYDKDQSRLTKINDCLREVWRGY